MSESPKSRKERSTPTTTTSERKARARKAAKRRREIEKLKRQEKPARNLGRKKRKAREEALKDILVSRLMLEHPAMGETKAEEQAEEEIRELRTRFDALEQAAEPFELLYEPWNSEQTIDEAWVHAILKQPAIQYLRAWLMRQAREGRRANLRFIASSFLWMAFAREHPTLLNTHKGLLGHPKRSWAVHDCGKEPSYKSMAKTMESMLMRLPAELPTHVLVETTRQIAEMRDDDGELLHPGATDVIAVDGTLIEAPLDQSPPVDKDRYQRRVRNRRGLGRTAYVVYRSTKSTDRDPDDFDPDSGAPAVASEGAQRITDRISARCNGWKFVVLYFPRIGVPAIGGLFPATVDERQATMRLLRELYRLWGKDEKGRPNLKIRYLLADALYDERKFCEELLFNYGILPVVAKGKKPSEKWPYVEGNKTDPGQHGVPECDHGLMVFRGREGYYLTDRRWDLELQPGEPAPKRDARNRFKCPAGMCPDKSTYPAQNARLYTYHPRIDLEDLLEENDEGKQGGETKGPRFTLKDRLAAERQVLQAMRNSVESFFAALKGGGLGNTAHLRAAWANDTEMEHLLVTGLIGRAARRLAWINGDYAESHEEAENLGLLKAATATDPSSWPQLKDFVQAMDNLEVMPRAPRSWVEEGWPEHPGVEFAA